MKPIFTRKPLLEFALVLSLATLGGPGAAAQIVEKVADLNIAGGGPGGPLDRFTQIGTNLWFTTEKGGTFDPAGTVCSYDLTTHQVTVVASLQNSTGTSPESSLLVIGDEGYFTTKSGGTGNAGTIARISLTNGAVTPLFHFPQNTAAARTAGTQIGATPRSSLTRIGDELWATTSLGGTSNRGVIVKYNLTNGLTSLVTNLDGPILGGQAFDGFAPVGSNAWYYTTFTGGDTFATPGLTLGAGILGRLSFDESGDPVIERLVSLPGGETQFASKAPTLVGTNSLYFGTVGPNSTPGAVIRYDLDTATWTNLFSFPTNTAVDLGARPGYCGMVEFRDELFFINQIGGISNRGAVVKFNIASNTVTKLADLEGTGAQSLGSASGFFGGGTLVQENGRNYIYFPLTAGGAFNNGTIIRIDLAAFKVRIAPESGGQVRLSWDGGYPPFTVQESTSLPSGPWSNVVENLTDRYVSLPATNPPTFFRVIGQP
jgi:hypothetical protein